MVVISEASNATTTEVSYALVHVPKLADDAQWSQEGVTVAGGKRWGNDLSHLNFPSGIYFDDEEQTIYIADYSNNRILAWKMGEKTGYVVVGEGNPGNRPERVRHPKDVLLDKANDCFIISDEGNRRVVRWPRKNELPIQTIVSNIDPSGLAVDHDGNLYVCDFEEHVVKRWKKGDTVGTVVAGGNGKGAHFHELSHPTFIFVDREQSVYVSDWGNHRIMKWVKGATTGIMVAGTLAYKTDLSALGDPFGLVVDDSGNMYVADWGKHRIVRWAPGAKMGTLVVGDGQNGNAATSFAHPMCIAFDKQGNLYVSDFSNNRIQKFNIVTETSTETPTETATATATATETATETPTPTTTTK